MRAIFQPEFSFVLFQSIGGHLTHLEVAVIQCEEIQIGSSQESANCQQGCPGTYPTEAQLKLQTGTTSVLPGHIYPLWIENISKQHAQLFSSVCHEITVYYIGPRILYNHPKISELVYLLNFIPFHHSGLRDFKNLFIESLQNFNKRQL